MRPRWPAAALVVPEIPETAGNLAAIRGGLRLRTAALRRSVHLRHVDAGSDGAEEQEIQALLEAGLRRAPARHLPHREPAAC